MGSLPRKSYGTRRDGTEKSRGFLGEIPTASGDVMTELSVGVDFGRGEMDVPTLVPSLTKTEVAHLASGGELTDEIVRKAVQHAAMRLDEGKPVFHTPYYKKNNLRRPSRRNKK